MEALKRQFTDVDAENTARTKIESMTQGVRTFTEYWNEFRLTVTVTWIHVPLAVSRMER